MVVVVEFGDESLKEGDFNDAWVRSNKRNGRWRRL